MIAKYNHWTLAFILLDSVLAQYYSGQFQQQSAVGYQRAPCQTGGCNQNYGYYQNRQQQSCPSCLQQFTAYAYQPPLPQPLQAPPTLAPVVPQRPVEQKPIPIPIPEEIEICPPCPTTPAATECPVVTCPQLICPDKGNPVAKTNTYEEHQTVRNDEIETTEQEVDPAQLDHEMLAMKDQEKKYRHRVAAAHFSQRRRKRSPSVDIVSLKKKCNNEQLRRIITQSIAKNIVATKVAIAERAAREIGGQFNVICTTGVFSYYAAARLFCEVSKKNVSCFVFRHDSIATDPHALARSISDSESNTTEPPVPKDSSAEIGVNKFDEAERRVAIEENFQATRRSEKAVHENKEGEIIYKSLVPQSTRKMSRLTKFISMKPSKRSRMNGGSAGVRQTNIYYL